MLSFYCFVAILSFLMNASVIISLWIRRHSSSTGNLVESKESEIKLFIFSILMFIVLVCETTIQVFFLTQQNLYLLFYSCKKIKSFLTLLKKTFFKGVEKLLIFGVLYRYYSKQINMMTKHFTLFLTFTHILRIYFTSRHLGFCYF